MVPLHRALSLPLVPPLSLRLAQHPPLLLSSSSSPQTTRASDWHTGENSERSDACAVGTWGMEAAIYALPTLHPLFREALPTDVIPRSALFAAFEGDTYLLFGLGDGQLVNYR